jgi:prevent-host-death family protein
MNEVGVFEAKTKLSALLDRVEKGEEIIITRHGKPVARLTAPARRWTKESVQAAVDRIKELRKDNRLGPDLTIQDLLDESRGRKSSS